MKPKKLSLALRRRLIAAAKKAQRHAYAPMSDYPVGAAVLGGSGRIHGGCNIESRTLIVHTCAERCAIFNAFSRGERTILAVATVSRASEPCGTCRQAIREYSSGDIPIYSVHHDPSTGKQKVLETSIARLLPRAHTSHLLELERAKKEKMR